MDTPLDPREMRKAILECAHRGTRVDGANSAYNMSSSAPIARAATNMAAREGWSGEDMMTWLAYIALCQLEKMYDAEVFRAVTMPSRPIVPLTPKP